MFTVTADKIHPPSYTENKTRNCGIFYLASVVLCIKYLYRGILGYGYERPVEGGGLSKYSTEEGRDSYMGARRTKLVFILIVYFAGFATAVYCLAPVPDNENVQSCEKGLLYSALKSDEFAQSFGNRMHKCADFSRDIAWRVGGLIRQKIDDRQLRSNE